MKLLFKIIIFAICFLPQLTFAGGVFDCTKYNSWNNTYKIFQSSIPTESKSFLSEINGIKKKDLISYGLMINELIINKKIDELIKNISLKEFKTYQSGNTSVNISSIIRKELLERKGALYFFLFDIAKTNIQGQKIDPYFGEDLDVRQYLICFKSKLKWKVLYNSKLNFYIVEYSIPDWLIGTFGNFAYKVREVDGKFILVGF